MADLRVFPREEETAPIFDLIDAYLLSKGWTIRGPESAREDANYGDSVYLSPRGASTSMGWMDAIGEQADIESGVYDG